MSEKRYIIYDMRGEVDTDEATVFESFNHKQEALTAWKRDWPCGVLFEYDLINGVAVNERRVLP